MYKVGSHYAWNVETGESVPLVEETTTEATTTEVASTTAIATEATVAETTAPASKNSCKSSVSLISVALLPAFAAFSATALRKKNKKD
jgi:hypothetical protein